MADVAIQKMFNDCLCLKSKLHIMQKNECGITEQLASIWRDGTWPSKLRGAGGPFMVKDIRFLSLFVGT